MERKISKTVEVNAPVHAVYGKWLDFEHFPKFMRGVVEVKAIDATHLHWLADVGGVTEEWDTEITRNIPDELIAWRSTAGAKNSGQVSFLSLSTNSTRVKLEVAYEPDGVVEEIGDRLGFVRRRIEGDLDDFKAYMEV